MTYTTKAHVADYLKRDLTNAEKTYLDNVLLGAVDEFIDNYTGSSFSKDDSATARYYDGTGCICEIDPCSDISSVETILPGTTEQVMQTLTLDDYVPYPRNGSTKTWLLKVVGSWPKTGGCVKVTAKWGQTAPPAIVHAATQLVATYLSSDKNLKSETIEGYSRVFSETVSDDKELEKILDQYTSVTI